MSEKHTIHLRKGGKVKIKGDVVELHLDGPLVFDRKHWICYLTPSEEARRALDYASTKQDITTMLAEAFHAVPMVVHPEED